MLAWSLDAAQAAGARRIVTIIGATGARIGRSVA